ncbi:MAG: MOSC domain-containing protein [Rhodospirillaceae bacterium]|nr:MOSC domain-containing protein [Rhodospirillaceae bacterium]
MTDENATENVGRVATLWRYPVQSLRGERLDTLEIGPKGPIGDRGWGIFDPEAGHIAISARGKKKWRPLVTWQARYVREPKLDAPLPPVEIEFEDGTRLMSDRADIDAKLADRLGWPGQFVEVAKSVPAYEHAHVHVLTSATLETFAKHYPSGRFEPERFRPNVFMTTEGLSGFVESGWIGSALQAGRIGLDIDEHCVRCVITTLPQGDLPQDAGILATVTETNKQHAGIYCSVRQAGALRLGDPVLLTRATAKV